MILLDETIRRVVIQGDDMAAAMRNAACYVTNDPRNWERCTVAVTVETGLPGGSYVTLFYYEEKGHD